MPPTGITRACESCRALKVRCTPAAEGTPTSQRRQCQRCVASGNVCTYTTPRRTKRKRTDVKIRELEQEVKSLGDLVRNGKAREPSEPQFFLALSDTETVDAATWIPPRLAQPTSPDNSVLWGLPAQSPDPIGAGLLSFQYAVQLFERYTSELAPQRPLVVFPSGASVSHLRTNTPTLLLAVLAATAGTLDDKLSTELNQMLVKTYAERITIGGDKSLELIQAILISTNWYYPPEKYDRFTFYQQLHVAATMAVEIGLGDATVVTTAGNQVDYQNLDGQRTLLACYICCSR